MKLLRFALTTLLLTCGTIGMALEHSADVTRCAVQKPYGMPWQYTVYWADLSHKQILDISVTFPLVHPSLAGYDFTSIVPRLTLWLRLPASGLPTEAFVGDLKQWKKQVDARLKYRFSSNYPTYVANNGFKEPISAQLTYQSNVCFPQLSQQPVRFEDDKETYLLLKEEMGNQVSSWMIERVNVVLRRRALDEDLARCLVINASS